MWGPAPNLGRRTPCQGQQEGARPSPTLAQTEQTPRGQGAGLGRHASPAGRGAVRHPRPQQSPGRRPRAPTRHCSEGRPSHDLLLSGQSRPLLAPSAPHTQGVRSVTPKEPLPSTQATVCQKPSVKHGKLSTCVGRWLVCPASRAALGRRAPDSPSCGTHGDDSCGAADGQEGWASGWTVGHGGKRSCSDQGLHSRGASCRKCESGLPRQPHLHTEARTALTLGPGAHKVPGWGALTFPNSAPAQL